jgi:inorganic pyrophosphatase
MFKLSKVLPEGMMFPCDFGFIPSTQSEDGDPLDVLLLMDEPTFPGCLLQCWLVGVIEALQEEKGEEHRNDRLIAVASQSIRYSDVHDLDDLNNPVLKQVEEFFTNCQRVRGLKFKIVAREGRRKAARMLEEHASEKNPRVTRPA